MVETIPTAFDPSDLPAWAQADPAVRYYCRRDYPFRCNVYRAETEQYRRALAVQARTRYDEEMNR